MRTVRVLRGDEWVVKCDRPGISVAYNCQKHGYIKPVLVVKDGKEWLACELCMYASAEISIPVLNGVEICSG